jgi:superfamily II DNA/RNA helicase
MPAPIKKLADKFLTNPKTIEVARPAATNTLITERLVPVADARKKKDILRDLIESEQVRTAIIFCNRKTTVRDLAKSLKSYGYRAGEIHGDMDQASRIKELDFFKSGEINILVASDVAARGLDIKGVSHVFNFDAPWHPDDYVHRIGRTGRAGATGKAFTFVAGADEEAIANIEKLTGHTIERLAKVVVAEKPKPVAKAVPAEAPAAREARPPQEARPPREERPSREARVPRELRPESSQAAPKEKPVWAPEKARPVDNDGPDEGWNGPVPSFLTQSF